MGYIGEDDPKRRTSQLLDVLDFCAFDSIRGVCLLKPATFLGEATVSCHHSNIHVVLGLMQ